MGKAKRINEFTDEMIDDYIPTFWFQSQLVEMGLSTIIQRHPWAVVQPLKKCENCLRTFKWTKGMEQLCKACKK